MEKIKENKQKPGNQRRTQLPSAIKGRHSQAVAAGTATGARTTTKDKKEIEQKGQGQGVGDGTTREKHIKIIIENLKCLRTNVKKGKPGNENQKPKNMRKLLHMTSVTCGATRESLPSGQNATLVMRGVLPADLCRITPQLLISVVFTVGHARYSRAHKRGTLFFSVEAKDERRPLVENPIGRTLRQTDGGSHKRDDLASDLGQPMCTVRIVSSFRFWEPSRGFLPVL